MMRLKHLEARAELGEIVFHLTGLVEAAEAIREQIVKLDRTIERDLDAATDAMGALEAEIYTHLAYHMKELRRPFKSYFRAACGDLEAQEKSALQPDTKPKKRASRTKSKAADRATRHRT